jgi:hypothetical protein
MAIEGKVVRQSVSLPPRLAKRIRKLAKGRMASANRVLVELIESGLKPKEAERQRFFTLADQLLESSDAVEQRRLKEELARMTFGE